MSADPWEITDEEETVVSNINTDTGEVTSTTVLSVEKTEDEILLEKAQCWLKKYDELEAEADDVVDGQQPSPVVGARTHHDLCKHRALALRNINNARLFKHKGQIQIWTTYADMSNAIVKSIHQYLASIGVEAKYGGTYS